MEGAASARPELGLGRRLAGWRVSGALGAGGGVLLVLAALYLAQHAAAGRLGALVDPAGLWGLAAGARYHLILAVVAAYTVAAGLASLAAAPRDLDALRPLMGGREAEWSRLVDRLTPGTRAVVPAALVGGFVGLGIQHLPFLMDAWETPLPVRLWSDVLMFLLFALLGVQSLISMRHSRVFYAAGRHHAAESLVDPSPLQPFARVGLRGSALWFGGSALASLLFVGASAGWVVALVLVVTVGLGLASLLVPSRGIHLRIRERKRAELARVRAAIARGGAALFAGSTGDADAARLPALIAYESRIAEVREWPFDTPTLGRFLLLLLIPLASWIGGALVERVVDAALG
jgi:hypothetical protein